MRFYAVTRLSHKLITDINICKIIIIIIIIIIIYIYIYIYKTETFKALTIFHISTILKKIIIKKNFFKPNQKKKKKHKCKSFSKALNPIYKLPSLSPQFAQELHLPTPTTQSSSSTSSPNVQTHSRSPSSDPR